MHVCFFLIQPSFHNVQQSGAMTGGASVSSGNSDRWEEREGELLRKKKGTRLIFVFISAAVSVDVVQQEFSQTV